MLRTSRGNSDLSISDEEGNVVLDLYDGEIRTKNFSSEGIKLKTGNTDADLSIVDDYGNVLAEFRNGSIVTKNLTDPGQTLAGKKVLFFGDSITYYKEYVNAFVERTGCIAYNRGLGSSCISNGGTNLPASFCYRVDL